MKTLNQLASEGIKYVVIKLENTFMWHDEIKAKVDKCYTISLVDLTQPTNLCELSVSYPYEEIRNYFDMKEGFTIEKDLCDSEYAELTHGYFKGDSTSTIIKAYNDERDFDECFENENCNPSFY